MSDRFFHPGKGWSPDPEGAELCLRRSADTNTFFSFEDGQWKEIDPEGLDPVRQALLWRSYPATGETRFCGLLQVDEKLRSGLLSGLAAEVEENGRDFRLPEEEASQFVERARAAGAQFREAKPTTSSSAERIEKILRADLQTLQELAEGDHSSLPDFEARGQQLRLIIDSEESGPARFAACLQARQSAERQVEAAVLSRSGDIPRRSPHVLPLLLGELARELSGRGVEAAASGGSLRISLDGYEILIGEICEVRPTGPTGPEEPARTA